MSTETPSRPPGDRTNRKRAWANGYTIFAVSIMIVLGVWQVLAGLTAVLRAGPYVATPGYTYTLDLAVWGMVLIVIGVLIGGAAVFVLRGQTRVEPAAIALAMLSMIANFLLIPFYPIWSLTIIGMGLTLMWALTTPDR